jgi:hypothetical protein
MLYSFLANNIFIAGGPKSDRLLRRVNILVCVVEFSSGKERCPTSLQTMMGGRDTKLTTSHSSLPVSEFCKSASAGQVRKLHKLSLNALFAI